MSEDEIIPDYDGDDDGNQTNNSVSENKGNYSGVYGEIYLSDFKNFGLKDEILSSIHFDNPTLVQKEVIPAALLGRDIVCEAESGMGKSLCFVLPILHHLSLQKKRKRWNSPQALVLCHTRELALQISLEFDRFSSSLDINTGCFFHGSSYESENSAIFVGTPGRILSLYCKKSFDFNAISMLVIDDCDKLLSQKEMLEDFQEIMKRCPHKKQVMFFSATLPAEIRRLCAQFVCSDCYEHFPPPTESNRKVVLNTLLQYRVTLTEKQKLSRLISLLDKLQYRQAVVFCRTCERADGLKEMLCCDFNFPADTMNGEMEQSARLECFGKLRSSELRILVTTDLIGRGIDADNINIVINFDCPVDTDTYLHRVGRTGRQGTKGLAITFVVPGQKSCVDDGDPSSASVNTDEDVLGQTQIRFSIDIRELPISEGGGFNIAPELYMNG